MIFDFLEFLHHWKKHQIFITILEFLKYQYTYDTMFTGKSDISIVLIQKPQ